MGYLFVAEGKMIDPFITATDSNLSRSLIKSKGHVWHKSSIMKKGEVPCPPGIDTDAMWGYSYTKKG